MKIKVRCYDLPRVVVRKPKKVKRRKPGFFTCGEYVEARHIKKNNWLSKKEKELLLDMCEGVEVNRVKKVRRSKRLPRPLAHYYVDGVIYRDGSYDEIISFKRV